MEEDERRVQARVRSALAKRHRSLTPICRAEEKECCLSCGGVITEAVARVTVAGGGRRRDEDPHTISLWATIVSRLTPAAPASTRREALVGPVDLSADHLPGSSAGPNYCSACGNRLQMHPEYGALHSVPLSPEGDSDLVLSPIHSGLLQSPHPAK